MFKSGFRTLVRRLLVSLTVVSCLGVTAVAPDAAAPPPKARKAICCSLCNGEPTDPGACRYGCNPDC